MRRSGSHLAVLVAIPVFFVLAYSLALIQRGFSAQTRKVDSAQVRSVQMQARILDDAILASIDSIRSQALQLLERPLAILNSSILHCAEIEVQGEGASERLLRVKQAQKIAGPLAAASSLSSNSFFDFYLNAALNQLDLAEIRRSGMTMMRVKRDPQHRDEWVAFGFAIPSSRNVVLALVDPAEAFGVFRRWADRGVTYMDRGYLVANDGYVLLHSEHSYWGADFSSTDVFREGVSTLFGGDKREVSGTYSGIDQNPGMTAIQRVGTLPLAVVVEHLVPKAGVFQQWQSLLPSMMTLIVGALVLMLGVVFLIVRKFASIELEGGHLHLAAGPQPQPAAPEPLANAMPSIIEEISRIAPALAASPSPSTPPPGPPKAAASQPTQAAPISVPAEVAGAMQNLQSAQAARAQEVTIRARHQDQVLVSQFESDATKIRNLRDSTIRLTLATSKIFDSPVLFFAYHSSVHAAILTAHAGFPGGQEPQGMSFPVTDAVIEKVFEVEKKSSVAALAEFTPLRRLIAMNYPGRSFQAWAVTGFAPSIERIGGPRLLGVLVTLDSVRSANLWQKPEQQSMLVRLLRATSLSYENSLLSQ